MPTCIYCQNEATSREHWIPRGLGAFRGYTPLSDRLCQECNELLGELDREFLRTGLTGFQRALLGIGGRHRTASVSPFHYKSTQANSPIRMMMPALGRSHEVLAEAYTDAEGRPSARPLRQVVLRMPDGGVDCVPFSRGWNGEQLRRAVLSRNLEGGVPVELYLEDDEDVSDQETQYAREIRTLLSSVFGNEFRAQVYGGTGERTWNRLAMIAGINILYLRSIAKVAFHYFLWSCPVLRGNEACFAAIRAFVRGR